VTTRGLGRDFGRERGEDDGRESVEMIVEMQNRQRESVSGKEGRRRDGLIERMGMISMGGSWRGRRR
jgi:hypothetical protein